MNGQPIITIDEFSGMGDENLVYNNGFLPEVINGKSMMTSGFTTENLIPKTFFENIAKDVTTFTNLKTTEADALLLMAGASIYISQRTNKFENGLIHLISVTGDVFISFYPDILELEDTNFIYTSANHLGHAINGTATGGSTTSIIDTTRHFGGTNKGVYDDTTTYSQYDFVYYEGEYYAAKQSTTGKLPINSTYWEDNIIPNEIAVGDKVTNIETGEIEEITSITTTTKQNDTLNFDATTETVANHNYIAFKDDAFELTDGAEKDWLSLGSSTRRQIKQYGNQYLILNGNYLAALSFDGRTIDNTFKQLPLRNEALCMEVSNDKLLVSSEYKGQGKLNLWNGSSDGWDTILDFDYPIKSLVAYKSGWLFISRGTLFYTDGYNIEKLSKVGTTDDLVAPDRALEPTYFNGLCYFDGKVYFANNYNDSNFIDYGVYCFDFDKGWTFIENNAGYTYIFGREPAYCVGIDYSRDELLVGGKSVVNYIDKGETQNYTLSNGRIYYSFINYINLPQETQIKGVGLNIFRPIDRNLGDTSVKKAKIYINIGDGSRGLLDFIQTNGASGVANKLKINGTYNKNNKAGDEIIIIDNADGDSVYRGERFFITEIENQGTTNELWTLDRNIGSTFEGEFKVLRVKNVETKVVSYDELNKEIMFIGNSFGFLSNKMFLEVVVIDDEDNPMPISITSIKIYG